jgi:hypothetical protein
MRRALPPSQFYTFCPRPHFISCIPPTRASDSTEYPFAALYIPYCIFILGTYLSCPISFHLRYYLSSIMSSTPQSTSSTATGFDKNLSSEALSKNPPVRVGYTCTQRSHSHCLLTNALPMHLRFPPSLASEHPQINPQDPLRGSRVAHPRVYRRCQLF